MDQQRKLELLQEQINEANGGRPADFALWRQKTAVVLRNVLGDADPLFASFTAVQYGLSIFGSDTPQSEWDRAQAQGVQQAIAILEAAKYEVELGGGAPAPSSPSTPGPRGGKTIFVVHGHDEARKHEVARFLRAATGNEPVILHEQASSGGTVIEKFETHALDAGYAVVIATGDDVGRAQAATEDRPRPRQNVVFELGFFFGVLGRPRVALLYQESVEIPSDIAGLVRIALDAAGAWKMLLAREIDAAGIGIDWSALR